MNMNRKIAIICWNENADISKYILPQLKDVEVDLFVKDGIAVPSAECCKTVSMPFSVDTMPKSKNFVLSHYKANGFNGYVHVIEDTISVLKDPVAFMQEVEKMMEILDISSYLGTVTDVCNYVYGKYNPRISVMLDKPEYSKLGLRTINFCSHSNTQWMVFNLAKADSDELYFNETFEIAMFWIIEYLARRRSKHPGSMYFMNQYVTVESERGLYSNRSMNSSDAADDPEKMKAENAKFVDMKVNYAPDNDVDTILERLYQKLNSKI